MANGWWQVIGWLVGRWSVEGGRLVDGFNKTHLISVFVN